jgi:hypothetical protein
MGSHLLFFVHFTRSAYFLQHNHVDPVEMTLLRQLVCLAERMLQRAEIIMVGIRVETSVIKVTTARVNNCRRTPQGL